MDSRAAEGWPGLIHLSHEGPDVGVNQRIHLMFCCLEVYMTLFAPMGDNWLKVCHGELMYILSHAVLFCLTILWKHTASGIQSEP